MVTSKKCVSRLFRYKNSLYRLKELGFVKIFSDNLAEATGVTAEQVRKDFSIFGISGNKRGGYQIDVLLEKLNNTLGKGQIQKAIVVGIGHIGTALTRYKGFEKESIIIAAAFDIDHEKHNSDTEVPVLPLEELKNFVKSNEINVGIIAVPDIAAQQVADIMVSSGIKGILNFAPISLKVPSDVIINNINLALELENIIYFMNVVNKKELKK